MVPLIPAVFASILALGAVGASAQEMSAEEFAARAQTLGAQVNVDTGQSAECLDLKRRAESLVGRPQLRSSAMNEYSARCQGSAGPALPTDAPAAFDAPPLN